MPLFSIITIVKDNPNGLRQTCKSIQKQTLKDLEWIVIDGTDKGQTQAFEKPLPYDFYINEPDSGIYDAMNKGITYINGQYCLFLNAGDVLANDHILDSIAAYLKPDIDFIYADSWEYARGKNNYKTARHHSRAELGMFTHHQSMIYKTELIKPMRYNLNYEIASDYDFTLRFLNQATLIKYCPAPLSIFQSGGRSQIKAKQGRLEQYNIRKNLKICSTFKNKKIYALQSLNAQLRKRAPKLYWFLKSRRAA